MDFQLTEGLLFRPFGIFRARARGRRFPRIPGALGLLLALLAWPHAALAFEMSGYIPTLQAGIVAGAALAGVVVCLARWAFARSAAFAAGTVFFLVEGAYRSFPGLLPPAAMQAGSAATLLAAAAPLLADHSSRLAAAARAASLALVAAAALTLIFIYQTDAPGLTAAIEIACALASLALCAALLRQAARHGVRWPSAALALVFVLSAGLWARDALSNTMAPAFTLALLRMLGVLATLAALPGHASHGRHDADPAGRGELRLSEMAGALESQRQMNALVSHELRAPLATISAAAQSLDMMLADTDEAVDSRLARIHRSVTRMTELVEQLLSQDRLGQQALTPRAECADMADIAHDVAAAMRPDTAHPLEIKAERGIPVFCDRPLTSVVVRNLVHNAIKYSPASEPVRIEAGQGEENGQPVAWLSVTDRGPGISEEDQARIFEPHFRRAAHRETKGLGIGLYLARNICENQGGSLTLHSKIGEGTRFVVTLPALSPATSQARQAAKT